MMRLRRNEESFKLTSPTPGTGNSRRSVLSSPNAAEGSGGSLRTIRRVSSSPGLAVVEHLENSCTEEAFLYHYIKKMPDSEKEVLLGQIMQGAPPSTGSPRRKSKRTPETGNFLWTPGSAKSEKRRAMKKAISSRVMGIKNLKMPF